MRESGEERKKGGGRGRETEGEEGSPMYCKAVGSKTTVKMAR